MFSLFWLFGLCLQKIDFFEFVQNQLQARINFDAIKKALKVSYFIAKWIATKPIIKNYE